MSNTTELAANFLQKSKPTNVPTPRAPISPFNGLFNVQELNEKENRAIEKILVDGYEPGFFGEETVEVDTNELKRITKELKAISKQGVILIGERIAKAREILKKYKEQSFRDWLTLTYGSFKSGYNYVSFYDLHESLPDHLKGKLKEMPAKAAYVLASKDAPIERKAEIVEHHASEPAQNIITIIQETLGTDQARKSNRKPVIDKILNSMEKEVLKLSRRKEYMDPGQKQRMQDLIDQLRSIIE